MSSLTISITEIDLRCSPSDGLRLLEADFRRAGLAGRDKRPGFASQRRKFGGVIADQVLRRGTSEQQRDEIVRHVALAAAQELCGRIDAGARGALLAAGTID